MRPSTLQRPVQTRRVHRAAILGLLRHYKELSRSELARRSGLSQASVSRIVRGLLKEGYLAEEATGRSTGGRPSLGLKLDDSRHLSIGVDIHDWETRISAGTMNGRVIASRYIRTPPGPKDALARIAEEVETLRQSCRESRIVGVGVSARGFVDSRRGVIEHGSDRAWSSVPVQEYLQERLGLPVYVENIVRAAAFAEYHYGDPVVRGSHCLVLILVDEGIGVGIMLGGKLYYGPSMAAGEFGQMVIADSRGDERHDRPGCLELLASNRAIYQRYASLNGGDNWNSAGVTSRVEQICHAAMEGDKKATKTLRETCRLLGIGISNIIWGLDPDVIVIDGVITEAWPLVRPDLRRQFADGNEFVNFRNLLLRPSSLAGEAAIIGAITIPFDPLFTSGGLPKVKVVAMT